MAGKSHLRLNTDPDGPTLIIYAAVRHDISSFHPELLSCFCGTIIPNGNMTPAAQPMHRPNNGHPNSRAQIHIDWLVGWCSDNGQTVCDPFMGSGTTGVACIKLGRPSVGIEIEPRYFDLACRRIDDAMRQGDPFSPRTPAADTDTPRLF